MTEETPTEEVDTSHIPKVSPYCSRCTVKEHAGRPHNFHETNKHDNWLELMAERETNIVESENLRGLFDE